MFAYVRFSRNLFPHGQWCRDCHTIKGEDDSHGLYPHRSVLSALCLMSQTLGIESNSRLTNESMLSKSEPLDVERLERQSVNYWRNDTHISIGSWRWRTYRIAQIQLFLSAFPPLLSLGTNTHIKGL